MSINTEAADLLHAVADLYECGALKWVAFSTDKTSMSLVVALLACREGHRSSMHAAHRAVATVADIVDDITREAPIHLYYWQCRKGRTTADVIALLRRAAQRLEEA